MLDPVRPLGHLAHDRQLVAHLMQRQPLLAEETGIDLPAQRQHRRGRSEGGEKGGGGVQQPRPRHHRADARPPGRLGVAERHIADALLVARADGADLRLGQLQGVHQAVGLRAWQGEDGVHAVVQETADDGLSAGELFGLHLPPLPLIPAKAGTGCSVGAAAFHHEAWQGHKEKSLGLRHSPDERR